MTGSSICLRQTSRLGPPDVPADPAEPGSHRNHSWPASWRTLHAGAGAPDEGNRWRASLPVAVLVIGMGVAIVAAQLTGAKSGLLLLAGAVALALGLCAVISPIFATGLLLMTLFLRLPIRSAIALSPELFFFAFAVLAVAFVLWLDRTPTRLRGIGAVEWAMAAYLMWNVYSMLAPHEYAAGNPLSFDAYSVLRFITIATVFPFGLYIVGRYMFDRTWAVHALLWGILTMAAYAAAVSVMPSIGLSDWVWPRYVVDLPESERAWAGRAVGIFNQPVANGMVLALSMGIALLLISRRSEPTWRRCVAFVIAVACGCGVYLTHTRAAWLGAVAVLVIGASLAKGFRRGFVAVLCLLIAAVVCNWSEFTSSDRSAGGVASQDELMSRLNDIQTALWAATQKPLEGWGIGRFRAVNLYHHQQWSLDVPWTNGWGGEACHDNSMCVLSELGLIGLTSWILVLALAAHRLWKAYKTLPDHDLCGKPLAVIAIMGLTVFVCNGFTVDLRYLDFPTEVVFLLAGITVGWADRTQLANEPSCGDLTGPVARRDGGRWLDTLHRQGYR
jgi:O-antigen ligase